MAKLTSVLNAVNTSTPTRKLNERHMPLVVDDELTLEMQISEMHCTACEQLKYSCNFNSSPNSSNNIRKKEYDNFLIKYKKIFNHSDTKVNLNKIRIKSNNLLSTLGQLVPCVGCRTGVERFYKQLTNSSVFLQDNQIEVLSLALDPLVIDKSGYLTINAKSFNPKALFELFYMHGSTLDSLLSAIPKIKKNRRCNIHSLDTHKIKNLGDWSDAWHSMSIECRNHLLHINADNLMYALDNYLKKHRFCSECKNKVIKAYKLLVGELDVNKEKGYCSSIFEGIKYCANHIHIKCDKEFVSQLIKKAEGEIQGRRERHAKTIDIAQEEVLACIGSYLYDTFHRIYQLMRSEEQIWQLLFHVGVYTLRKCFEFELEKLNECLNNQNNQIVSNKSFATTNDTVSRKGSRKAKNKMLKPVVASAIDYKAEEQMPLFTSFDDDLEICQCQIDSENDDDPNTQAHSKCNCEMHSITTKSSSSICSSPLSHDYKKCWNTTINSISCGGRNNNSSYCDIDTYPNKRKNQIDSKNLLNSKISTDAGYSSDHESNTCLELCCNVDSLLCNIDDCKCQDPYEMISCNEIIVTQAQICNCDFYRSEDLQCDIIRYSQILEHMQTLTDDKLDKMNIITDEEKKEYYENQAVYLKKRSAHRLQLREKLKALNFEIKPKTNGL